MPALTTPSVAPARGGPITDQILDQLHDIACRLQKEPISDAEGALLIMSLPGCLKELHDYRHRSRLARSLLDPGNVVTFPGQAS